MATECPNDKDLASSSGRYRTDREGYEDGIEPYDDWLQVRHRYGGTRPVFVLLKVAALIKRDRLPERR